MMTGYTLDTGALIALERRDRRMYAALDYARTHTLRVSVPAVVVIEWWRGGRGQRAILERLHVEPTTDRIARIAGEAIGKLGATAIDAAVMATAALRGDVVFTSDFSDLDRLRQHFPSVRLLRT